MKRHVFVLLVVLLSQPLFADVGIRVFPFVDKERQRTFHARVWYPAEKAAAAKPLFDGPVFLPVNATENAPIVRTPARFPLIVLSHGSGGLGVRLSWLAEFLVEHGYLVVTFDHPGNRAEDNSPEGVMRVWDRARDVSFVLTQILRQDGVADRIDPARIGAVGHSAGGTTVLLLAGGRLDRGRLTNPIPGCAGGDPEFLRLCAGMKKLNPKKYSKDEVERSYRDERIHAAVALDPGFGPSFDPRSLSRLNADVLILASTILHEPEDDIRVRDFRKAVSPGSYEAVERASHFTFVTACKPGAELRIPDVADVCWKSDERPVLQERIRERILKFFEAAM